MWNDIETTDDYLHFSVVSGTVAELIDESGDNPNSSFTFVQTLIKCIISSFYMCFVIDYPHNPIRS